MATTKLIFLQKTDGCGETEYFAVYENKIETLNFSDTYDMWGNQTSTSDAGDYLTLKTQKAVSIANSARYDGEETSYYAIGEDVSAYDDSDAFDAVVECTESGVDYIAYYTECEGFNYWDGSNWKSVLVKHDFVDNLEWKIVSDKDLVKSLRTAVTRKSECGKGAGYVDYKFGKFLITESFCAGSWDVYRIGYLNK